MAEIKSTMDLVMEKLARMDLDDAPDLDEEELQREGMRRAAEYLRGEKEELSSGLNTVEIGRQPFLQGLGLCENLECALGSQGSHAICQVVHPDAPIDPPSRGGRGGGRIRLHQDIDCVSGPRKLALGTWDWSTMFIRGCSLRGIRGKQGVHGLLLQEGPHEGAG